MLNIPYESNPGNACALACYTMVARWYFPDITFEEMGEICDYEPGYVIWPFKFWLWIMGKGIRITDYDVIDYHAWSNLGTEGLKQSISDKEFNFIKKNTKSLDAYPEVIKQVLAHKRFSYIQKKPRLEHVEEAFANGAVCEVVLDSHTLDRMEGFALHRVVVVDVTKDEIVFHDPRKTPQPARRESKEHFVKAWVQAPELCVYQK